MSKTKPDFQAIAGELDTMAAELAGCTEICNDASEKYPSNAVALVANVLDRMNWRLSAIAASLPKAK